MVHCILLAAGFSRRFGENKLIHPVEGKMLFRHTADLLLELASEGLCTCRLVTRPGLLPPFPMETILCSNAWEGIAASLRAGLSSLPEDGGAAAFFVADQPYLKKETVKGLLNFFPECGKGILCCGFGERTGNPAIFARRYFPELLNLQGDKGGKRVMQAHPEDTAIYPVQEERELLDVDERT